MSLDTERWLNVDGYRNQLARMKTEAVQGLMGEVSDLPDGAKVYKLAAAAEAVLEQLGAALADILEDE